MIDTVILVLLVVILIAGSVRIAIEVHVRRRARAETRARGDGEPPSPPAIADEPAAMRDFDRAEPPAAGRFDGDAVSADPPPAALFSVEMGAAKPRLRIAIGDRAIPVDIEPWQAVALARSLLAAGAACAPGAPLPEAGTVFP